MKESLILTLMSFGLVLGNFQVESAVNVSLPTRTKQESVGKTLYPKRFVNESAVPLKLKCVFTTTAPKIISTVAWRHNGKYLHEGEEYDQKMVSEAQKHVAYLIINKPKAESLGKYECKLSVSVGEQMTEEVEVVGPPMTLLQKEQSLRVPEESKLSLKCGFRSSPSDNLKIEWFRGNYSLPLTLDAGMKIEDEVEEKTGKILAKKNVLTFESIKATAKGMYFCKVSNGLGEDYLGWQIRVKNRYAFLWPLIGIILEVIVVVVIIVVYEIKRNKKRKAKLLAQQNLQYNDEDCQGMARKLRCAISTDTPLHVPSMLRLSKSWAGMTDFGRKKSPCSGWIEGGHMMLPMPKRPSLSELISDRRSIQTTFSSICDIDELSSISKRHIASTDHQSNFKSLKRLATSLRETKRPSPFMQSKGPNSSHSNLSAPSLLLKESNSVRPDKPLSRQSKRPHLAPFDKPAVSGQLKRPHLAPFDKLPVSGQLKRPEAKLAERLIVETKEQNAEQLDPLASSARSKRGLSSSRSKAPSRSKPNSTLRDQSSSPAQSKRPNSVQAGRLAPFDQSKRKTTSPLPHPAKSKSSTPERKFPGTVSRQRVNRIPRHISSSKGRNIRFRPQKDKWPPLGLTSALPFSVSPDRKDDHCMDTSERA